MNNIMPPINTPDSKFHDGNPLTGVQGTIVTAEFMNNTQSSVINVQTELKSILTAANIQINDNQTNQVLQSLQALFMQRSNNLNDIPDIPVALQNLGLKGAAKRDVGNGVNQIPDMSSFTSSRSTNGYIKLPGGLIIQWGTAIPDSGGAATILYPLAFVQTPYSILFGYRQNQAPNGMQSVIINDPTSTNTGCAVRAYRYDSGGLAVSQSAFYWCALGAI
ncbi:gp53-like domain-containing protein [Limnobaculum xujianqingii]|uniref:gp53-like domain-containing protein n=1 Tax=Limnobaculum xujianqingii TaxID=2738837 RepID=UPI001128B0D4|nr:hypothetical protein [Limnobaculum xujianqingii]